MAFSRLWLALFSLGAIPLLLTAVAPVCLDVALAWYFLLITLALTDWFMLIALPVPEVTREVPDHMAPGAQSEVTLRVHNLAAVPIAFDLMETPPDGFNTDLSDQPFYFPLDPRSRARAIYRVEPLSRGLYRFGDAYLRLRGRLRMVNRLARAPLPTAVKVFPSLDETAKFSLAARRGRLQQIGIRNARLQGTGSEFESLRDYQPDDEQRRIDWKATARRGKLVSRQYEVERSQNVILAIDLGRNMLAEIDGAQKLDYAIRAALLLAYVATLSDDRVGLLVFSDVVHTFLPPRKGRAQVYTILETLYDVRASLLEPDYAVALAYLRSRWKRRSLVVCFTDLWDPDSSRQTISELAGLQPHHLVAAVTLLDSRLPAAAGQPVTTAQSVYEKAVAQQSLDDRGRAIAALTQRGVLVVDSPADQLSAALVNRYLEVKERMLL